MAAEARILVKRQIPAGEVVRLSEGSLLLLSGVGAERARFAARTLLENGAKGLVSWGFAGGLAPELSTGSLILPERVMAPDQFIYPVDLAWHEKLCRELEGQVDLYRGTLAESPGVLAGYKEKIGLFRRTQAIAVDMESASIALVAKEAEVPLMVIRAITDTAEMTIPRIVLRSADEFGRVRLRRLLSYLARRPGELMNLIRLARSLEAARTTLATVARKVGNNLLFPSDA